MSEVTIWDVLLVAGVMVLMFLLPPRGRWELPFWVGYTSLGWCLFAWAATHGADPWGLTWLGVTLLLLSVLTVSKYIGRL